MKFHCEYCKELIDSEKDKKCPNCGASYKNNKEYEKLLEEKKEQQKEFNNHVKKVSKLAIIPFFMIPIIFIGVFALIVTMAIRSQKNFDNNFDDLEENVEEIINTSKDNLEEEKEVEPVIVNQEKSSADYKVKVEKYRLLEQKDDKEYDKLEVTVIVEKISDKFSAWGETIYCLVDNVSQNRDSFNSDISTHISDKGIPLSKKMTYYVPKNLKSFDIKYGNILSFHVDLKND